jgi:hypothetical protein
MDKGFSKVSRERENEIVLKKAYPTYPTYPSQKARVLPCK